MQCTQVRSYFFSPLPYCSFLCVVNSFNYLSNVPSRWVPSRAPLAMPLSSFPGLLTGGGPSFQLGLLTWFCVFLLWYRYVHGCPCSATGHSPSPLVSRFALSISLTPCPDPRCWPVSLPRLPPWSLPENTWRFVCLRYK
ncbi:hypothetical protein BJ322DRAFT_533275 [Thelephora terrestris]|uniref:Uncharacterized protein n=1 Tax=Thelephora terrestris TaxID=56493 RepID=A0A9P6HL04_9AGAM|nr:hypothetical protein BJ322DRAFT_533275 [Thelephora terrestris]